jgi:uncharacterized protein YkwD
MRIVEETNVRRKEAGCPPVIPDEKLAQAARIHAENMVASDFFDHVSPDGSTLVDRIEAAGYPYRLVGENLAAGLSSAAEVVEGWMESEEHRENIVNCEFSEIGVSYVFAPDDPGQETWQHYWVQVFGVRRGE